MKKERTFAVQVYTDQYHYRNWEGRVSFYTEDMILRDLRRQIEWWGDCLGMKYQASIKDRSDLDRYLEFTQGEPFLFNEWEFTSDESFLEPMLIHHGRTLHS
jgi:hypothetical protein